MLTPKLVYVFFNKNGEECMRFGATHWIVRMGGGDWVDVYRDSMVAELEAEFQALQRDAIIAQ